MSTNKKAPWTDQENAALVRMYFDMLHAAVNGHPYNKAQMIRMAQNSHAGPIDSGLNTAPLKIRSRGSIEAKLMNASAAHRDYWLANHRPNAETMATHGYKAWGNYQAALYDAMRDEIGRRNQMRHEEGVA